MDAYGGLLYLAYLPFVDPERFAVVGYSLGAMVALSAVAHGAFESVFDHHFRAALLSRMRGPLGCGFSAYPGSHWRT